MVINYSLSTDWKAEEEYTTPFNFSSSKVTEPASDVRGASVRMMLCRGANFNLHILHFNNLVYYSADFLQIRLIKYYTFLLFPASGLYN